MERSIASSLFIQFSLSFFGFLLLVSLFSDKPTGIAKGGHPIAYRAQVEHGQ
jgi:hypothetical protein